MHSHLLAAKATIAFLATGAVVGALTIAPAAVSHVIPLAMSVPRTAAVFSGHESAATACTLPDGTPVNFYHCYTPADIRAAYGVNSVADAGGQPNLGQDQTIVLVDAYGSPTAAQDLGVFHDTFFPALPAPNFDQMFPQGNPQYNNTANGNGQSGPSAAAGWSGEATLDIEWAYSIAPLAHIVLLAVPPAETEGVQGLPNLFKAISGEIDNAPDGTLFSMSFGLTEQTFGGAAATQTAKFDQVFKKGLARHDNFFASSGDDGSLGVSKLARGTGTYSVPTVGWPASSPYVVSVGGTQLQRGWTWNPSSNDAFTASGDYNPAYWQSTPSGNSEAAWNESWAPIGTGGGVSTIYSKPSWQTAGPAGGRVVPDTAWNAAVNGGVDVYISAFPSTTAARRPDAGASTAAPRPHRPRQPDSLPSSTARAKQPRRRPSGSSTRCSTRAWVRTETRTRTSPRCTTAPPRKPSPETRSAWGLCRSQSVTSWITSCGSSPCRDIRRRAAMTRRPDGVRQKLQGSSRPSPRCNE